MTKSASTLFLIASAVMLVPVIAFAGSPSTDWTLGPGGVYSYSGGTSSLEGYDIPILSVLGDSTSSHNGVSLPVIDGLLNFTSGVGTSGTWSWASGGTLDITGCISGVTGNSCNPAEARSATNLASGEPTIVSREHDSISASRRLAYRMRPLDESVAAPSSIFSTNIR